MRRFAVACLLAAGAALTILLGVALVSSFALEASGFFDIRVVAAGNEWGLDRGALKMSRTSTGGTGTVTVPLWIPLLIAGGATTWLAFMLRPIPGRGHCLSCGYDLRGAPSATCPECGTLAP